MSNKTEPFFCPGCNYRAWLYLTKKYTQAADERKCPECRCILCFDYGPWHGEGDSEEIESEHGMPIDVFEEMEDEGPKAGHVDRWYYDYSTDDINDFEYQQDLYSE